MSEPLSKNRLRDIHWALYLGPVAWVGVVLFLDDLFGEPDSSAMIVVQATVVFVPLAALLIALPIYRLHLARRAQLTPQERRAAQMGSLGGMLSAQVEAERVIDLIEQERSADNATVPESTTE